MSKPCPVCGDPFEWPRLACHTCTFEAAKLIAFERHTFDSAIAELRRWWVLYHQDDATA